MKIYQKGKEVKPGTVSMSPFAYSHQRGVTVLDSICAFETKQGPAIFRLADHLKRFFYSALKVNMNLPFSPEQMAWEIKEAVRKSKLSQCYIRPIAYYPEPTTDILPPKDKINFLVGIFPFPKQPQEIRIKISSYIKPSSASVPVDAKISGHYLSSSLAKKEAQDSGFDDALFLDQQGYLAEAPTSNFFIVKEKTLYTASLDSILAGITRSSVIKIAKDLNYQVKETNVSLDELLQADEVFLTSSSINVLPVVQINQKKLLKGQVTQELRAKFEKIIHGQDKNYLDWLNVC